MSRTISEQSVAMIAFPTYSHLNELFVFRCSKTGTAKGQPVKNGHNSFRNKIIELSV